MKSSAASWTSSTTWPGCSETCSFSTDCSPVPRVKFAGSYLETRIVQAPQLKCVSGYLFASTRHSGFSD